MDRISGRERAGRRGVWNYPEGEMETGKRGIRQQQTEFFFAPVG